MNERTSKYKDEFSKKTALKILKMFYGTIRSFRDMKLDDNDPSKLVFRVYVGLIKQNPQYKPSVQPLPKLLNFLEEFNATCRMYIDLGKICIELTIPRPSTI